MRFVGEVLTAEGFVALGHLRHDLDLAVWWHPTHRIQIIAVSMDQGSLLKGSKPYALVSGAGDDEMWARDLAAAQDYLESYFREVHFSWSFFRDVPSFLAERHARQRVPSPGHAAGSTDPAMTFERVRRAEAALQCTQRLVQVDSGDSGLLSQHLRTREAQGRVEVEQLRVMLAQAEGRAELLRHLQQEYRRKGSAMCLLASIASNLQVATSGGEASDAVRAIVKELLDAHRFQVTQTFTGGRLKIGVAEIQAPALAWIEQWFGGALTPAQLERLKGPHPPVAEALSRHTTVTVDEDVEAEGTVIERRKLVAPRLVTSILDRLDPPQRPRIEPGPNVGPRLNVGLCVAEDGSSGPPWSTFLRQLGHTTISGSTGSGKSVAARVFVEEIFPHDGVNLLVLDPRNQSAGLRAPQDRPEFLERFAQFGLESPRPFAFEYFAPGRPALPPVPADLGRLAHGRAIVSFKALDDEGRCDLFARILDAAFEWSSREESESVRLVIVVEEAQLFTRRLVGDSAKPAAARAETSLDRVLREGRKYGLAALISSQSIMDFVRDAAAIRQNATTKIFFHNSDREIEYARDYLDDARELVRLPPGIGLICNPAWGVVRVAVRPPLSKVWDFSDVQTAALLGRGSTQHVLSPEAALLLDVVREHAARTGSGLNVTQAGGAAGITSRRRLHDLVEELTGAGRVRTRRLAERGQPRVIEPTEDPNRPDGGTEGGPNADANGQETSQHDHTTC